MYIATYVGLADRVRFGVRRSWYVATLAKYCPFLIFSKPLKIVMSTYVSGAD